MREEIITKMIADKLGDLAFDDEAIEIMYEAAKQKIGENPAWLMLWPLEALELSYMTIR